MIRQRFFGPDAQRRRALKRASGGPLGDYLRQPFPSPTQECRNVDIVALDLETTGLDPRRDHILSIGLVVIRDLSIHLDTSWQQLIRTDKAIPEHAAIVHGITDDRAAEGRELINVMPELLQQLAGRIMLVHHAALERGFLERICQSLYGGPFLIPTIDTEKLARRRFERRGQAYRPADLRLANLRQACALPRHTPHNALSDALAAAELFLAMVPEQGCCLAEVLTD